MAKLTRAEVKERADEWAGLEAKIFNAEAAKNAELDPFIVAHNEAVKPILDRHDAKIEKLREKRDEIEREVLGWLNGAGKALVVEGEKAIAANEVKQGNRVIDLKKFLDYRQSKGNAVYECLSVAVAKAEKLVGKTEIDRISTKETKLVAVLKLK